MIEVKSKACKGQNKAKGQKGCGKLTKYRRYGLCSSCYADFILNTDAGKILLEKATLKATKPRRELEKAEKEHKNRNNLTTLIKSVVDTFHKYVRERDKGKECIACGTQWKGDFQASHFYKAELYTSLKFHENNVHSGCMECNLRKEGNINQYSQNLPLRIGKEKYNELIQLAEKDKLTTHKWDREELKKLRAYYNQKYKELIS